MGLEEAKAFVDGWVQREGAGRDRLLPLLHAVQDEIGYI
ncbi:MAG: NADH-quinone oxidoreductase subunit E, partial [Sphingobium sp.]